MLSIRAATIDDLDAIVAFDHVAQNNKHRVEKIKNAIGASQCYVGVIDAQIVAYGVMHDYFYEQCFVDLIYVRTEFRRQSISLHLLQYFEKICKTKKLFTSTNQSNKIMQKSFEKANFQKSGIIENLDKDDPEIVYFKQVTEDSL